MMDQESRNDIWHSAIRSADSGDGEKAIYHLRRLAEDGVSKAMAEIGVIYEAGTAGVSKDIDKAIGWYSKAAEEGDLEGVLAIARLHLTGIGVEVDYDLARKTYKDILSKTIEPRALFGLGWIYFHGLGVPVNLDKAEECFKLAMSEGHLLAGKSLAAIYRVKGAYLKSIPVWLGSVFRIIKMAISDRKSILLHRQL